MKTVIAFLLLAASCQAQFFGSSNAKKLAGVPFICASPSDNDVISYDLATTSWICTAGTGGATVTSPLFTPNGTDYFYLPTITRPSARTWAWVNQGSATLITVNGIETIRAPANAVPHLKIRQTSSLPTPPYTIIARVDGTTPTVNYIRMGVGLRESATGKMKTINTVGGLLMAVETWTDATTYGGSIDSFAFYRSGELCFKIANDGTNITWSYSGDCASYEPVNVAVKADGFTTAADQAIFFIDTNNSTRGASVTLKSFSIN